MKLVRFFKVFSYMNFHCFRLFSETFYYTNACCYYLCDNGYTNCDGFLAPYRNVRYHLKEWGTGNSAPRNAKELFNMRHASARNVIERAWGILKTRWAILRSASYYPVQTLSRIIFACALLHNFVRMNMAYDPLEAEVSEKFTESAE